MTCECDMFKMSPNMAAPYKTVIIWNYSYFAKIMTVKPKIGDD